jgi:hypothetical protein
MRRVLVACAALFLVTAAVACGSDDEGSSPGGTGGGTAGGAGAAGTAGSGGAGTSGTGGGTSGTGGGTSGTGGGTSGTGGASGSAGTAGSGGASGAAGTAGAGGGGNTTTLTITITDIVQDTPIKSMDVCVYEAEPENCANTDDFGLATLEVPTGEDIILTYGSTLSNFRTHMLAVGASAVANGTHITTGALLESMASYMFSTVGIVDDATKGHVVGTAFQTEGATAAIDPASGEGPIYTEASGIPNLDLTETSTAGAFLFTNVDPGTVEVSVDYSAGSCVHQLGHQGSAPNATPVAVKAGWFTAVSAFVCN